MGKGKEGLFAAAGRAAKLLLGCGLVCACCGADRFGDAPFCERCMRTLPFNNGYVCGKCGRAIGEEYPVCLECKADMPAFTAARSAFRYEGEIVRLVKAFKTGKRYLAETFADSLLSVYAGRFAGADFFVPVPMTDAALRKRGYNQSLLLASALSERTGVPVCEVAVKTRETAAQKFLSRRERFKNLQGSFRIAQRKACRGKNIVIVDDVLTTGATASALAASLLRAGARQVGLLTAASVSFRAQPKKEPKLLEKP